MAPFAVPKIAQLPLLRRIDFRFFENAGGDEKRAHSEQQRVYRCFQDGTMESIFQQVALVIDSGGLYDQYNMDTKTAVYLDLCKFFTARECAENEINLTSALYTNLGRIIKDYIDNTANEAIDFSQVNMIVTCCMLLVGQGRAISAAATPFLLNALLLMATNDTRGNLPILSRLLRKEVSDLYHSNWTIGLLKIAHSEQQSEIMGSMTIDEKNAYKKLIAGESPGEDMFKRPRKLSIMMLAEGVIVQNDRVVKLLAGEYQDDDTRLEPFLLRAESKNGFLKGQRRNWYFVQGARLYLVVTFAFSLFVVGDNVAERDNYFERITDGLTCITVLWFTVFGLIKLQSDDQNIIRNLVLGRVPTEHEDELVAYLNTDIESVKVALCRTVRDYGWLSRTDCCYVKGQTRGKIEILGGLQAKSCDRAGLVEVDEGVVFDLKNSMFGMGSKEMKRLHVDNWARSTEKWLIVNRVPGNCVVAGHHNVPARYRLPTGVGRAGTLTTQKKTQHET